MRRPSEMQARIPRSRALAQDGRSETSEESTEATETAELRLVVESLLVLTGQ